MRAFLVVLGLLTAGPVYAADKPVCAPLPKVLQYFKDHGFTPKAMAAEDPKTAVMFLADAKGKWVELMLIKKDGQPIACIVDSGFPWVTLPITPDPPTFSPSQDDIKCDALGNCTI